MSGSTSPAEDRDVAVADAKYKELKPDEWPNADLYQMLAYCASLGLPSGLPIYASDRPYEEHLVEQAGVCLGIIGVDMNGSPRDLDASADGPRHAPCERRWRAALELR